MAATKPVGKISQVDNGKFVDEDMNLWSGTKDAPVYGGAYSGPRPAAGNWVDVYGGGSPNAAPTPTPPTQPPTGGSPTPAPAPPPGGATPPYQPPGAANTPTPPATFQTGGTATTEQQVAEFYRTLLGRDASPDEIALQMRGGSGDLATIQRSIGESPEAQAYSKLRSSLGSQAGGNAQPTAAYLQSLIAGGMSPQEAIAKFNRDTGRTTGNEAVYYGPEVHGKPTIGLPGEYLSQEGNGWQVTARSPETGAQAGPTAAKGLSYADVLAQANAYASGPGGWGRGLSASDIDAAKRDLGFQEGAVIDPGQLPVIQKWIDAHKPATAGTGGTTTTTGTAPPGPTAGGNPSGSAGSTGGIYGESDVLGGFRDAIKKRLSDINSPVDENASQIREPMSAARNEAQRVSDQERTALAERLYAGGGLNTAGVDRGIQQSAERNAVGLGSLKASLITREYDARRQDLQNMLAQATASGDNASARAIQQELAQLQAQLTREGFGIDLSKFSAYLNQNAAINGLNG